MDIIKLQFKDKSIFETQDIAAFYKQREMDVTQTTINWRIYNMVQMGVLQRIGRGKFTLGAGKNYIPEITSKIRSIHSKVKTEFPYLTSCIWNTSVLNEFMIHQPNRFYYLVEVDKEATNSVFYFLKEAKYAVFLDPTQDIIEKYLPTEKDIVIIKSLVSEAPLLNIKGIITASIEKILVDIFCDDVIFSAQQGSEMRTIFAEAFGKYTINQSKMLRYSNRRRKKEPIIKVIGAITNLRQK